MLKGESHISHNELSHYVIVDDGGNYVTFHKLNVRIKIKKMIIPHNDGLSRLCSSMIGLSKFVYFF